MRIALIGLAVLTVTLPAGVELASSSTSGRGVCNPGAADRAAVFPIVPTTRCSSVLRRVGGGTDGCSQIRR